MHADADGGLEFASDDREIRRAKHFRLIGARNDADRKRARGEGRDTDEALMTDRMRGSVRRVEVPK